MLHATWCMAQGVCCMSHVACRTMRSQRNAIGRAVGDAPASSLLLISDVDELVMPALVRLLKACEGCASRRPSPAAITGGHRRRPSPTAWPAVLWKVPRAPGDRAAKLRVVSVQRGAPARRRRARGGRMNGDEGEPGADAGWGAPSPRGDVRAASAQTVWGSGISELGFGLWEGLLLGFGGFFCGAAG